MKMSNLKQLLKEKCPNGVEYVKIGDVCTITKGKTPIQKAIPGEYPLVVTTSEHKSCNTYQFDNAAVCIPLVSSRGHGVASLNHVYFQSGKFALGNILCAVIPNDEKKLSANYLYHYLEYKKDTLLVPLMKGGANVSLHIDDIQRVKIPLPPLEVQLETIEILDKFVELSEILTKELFARQNQYKYYRDLLLDFGVHGATSECEWCTINDIAIKVASGKNKEKKQEGAYPVYGSTGIIAYCDKFEYNKKQILIARVGANAGYVHIADGEYDVSDNTLILDVKDSVIFEYIYYLLVNMNLNRFAKGGGQPLVTAGQIKEIKIPVPPIKEQKRIVSILDRFDKLCNDISEGLPAEIEARRKQYEYYRDKLLCFEEVKV